MNFEKVEIIERELKDKLEKILPLPLMSLYKVDGYHLVFHDWSTKHEDLMDNIWKVDENFNVIWKVEKYLTYGDINERVSFPYTGVSLKDGELRARNFDGVDVKLDFETGKITNIPGQRPW